MKQRDHPGLHFHFAEPPLGIQHAKSITMLEPHKSWYSGRMYLNSGKPC